MKLEAKFRTVDGRLAQFVCSHIHRDGGVDCNSSDLDLVLQQNGRHRLVAKGWGGTVDGHLIGEDGILLETDDGVRIILRVEDVIQPEEW